MLLIAALTAFMALAAALLGLVAARSGVALAALMLSALVTFRALESLPRDDLAGRNVRVTHAALGVALTTDLIAVGALLFLLT
ncbi:MAG: hypothetical protein H0W72_10655 [Planctomycetes bacterium]|nr:hypothetical protein [Planctomycetota bacterium]